MPDTIALFLATASLGGVWSSCSPDFGERGILDRFGQIAPRVLIACDGYYYAGKIFASRDKIAAVLQQLPSVEQVVIIDYLGTARGHRRDPAQRRGRSRRLPRPARRRSRSTSRSCPSIIRSIFSIRRARPASPNASCIAPAACCSSISTSICSIAICKREDRLFYFTTCGWMMWNWLVSGLAAGATLLLYDGSPFHPNERALFDYADEEGMTIFGTSAKYIDAVKKTGLAAARHPRPLQRAHACCRPARRWRRRASTSSMTRSRATCISPRSRAAPTSVGCFVAGNPLAPVWRGEIQGPVLGMAVDVYDEHGKPLRGRQGRARLHQRPSRRCRSGSGTIPTARNTAPPISSASPISGAMAISPNGPSMAASSSMAAPMRRSIPAACGSARPKSMPRSSRFPR